MYHALRYLQIRKVKIDASKAPYNGLYQLVAVNGGATFKIGDVSASDTKVFDISAVSGDIVSLCLSVYFLMSTKYRYTKYDVRVTSDQQQAAKDSTDITYVNNASFQANYAATGTAIQPAITFTGYTPI